MRAQIKMDDKWTFDDFGFWLGYDLSLEPAKVKANYVDIPASDNSLDLTESISGEPRYERRKLTFSLIAPLTTHNAFEQKREAFENYCNGKELQILLPNDTRYYLIGRISLIDATDDNSFATLKVEITCDAWRYKQEPTEIVITDESEHIITNDRKTVVPNIASDSETMLTINGVTRQINAGFDGQNADLCLKYGENTIQKTRAGSVTLTYQEGSL